MQLSYIFLIGALLITLHINLRNENLQTAPAWARGPPFDDITPAQIIVFFILILLLIAAVLVLCKNHRAVELTSLLVLVAGDGRIQLARSVADTTAFQRRWPTSPPRRCLPHAKPARCYDVGEPMRDVTASRTPGHERRRERGAALSQVRDEAPLRVAELLHVARPSSRRGGRFPALIPHTATRTSGQRIGSGGAKRIGGPTTGIVDHASVSPSTRTARIRPPSFVCDNPCPEKPSPAWTLPDGQVSKKGRNDAVMSMGPPHAWVNRTPSSCGNIQSSPRAAYSATRRSWVAPSHDRATPKHAGAAAADRDPAVVRLAQVIGARGRPRSPSNRSTEIVADPIPDRLGGDHVVRDVSERRAVPTPARAQAVVASTASGARTAPRWCARPPVDRARSRGPSCPRRSARLVPTDAAQSACEASRLADRVVGREGPSGDPRRRRDLSRLVGVEPADPVSEAVA